MNILIRNWYKDISSYDVAYFWWQVDFLMAIIVDESVFCQTDINQDVDVEDCHGSSSKVDIAVTWMNTAN